MAEAINLGFIGTGGWARAKHLPALDYIRKSAVGGCGLKLRGICLLNEREAAEVAQQYGFERVYRDIDELAADDELDAVAVVVMATSLEDILPKRQGLGQPVHASWAQPLAKGSRAARRPRMAEIGGDRWIM
jgi:hypothetical protein